MARIAYGDPSSDRTQFLDYWLDQQQLGLLALSYPTDHPAVEAVLPDLTIKAWSGWVAAVTSAVLKDTPMRPVAVAMWSMAGRSVAAINTALLRRNINVSCFLSMAATPPLPGLMPLASGGEKLTTHGLWARTLEDAPDGIADRFIKSFLKELNAQRQLNGNVIVSDEVYLRQYICNTPIMLRGTPQRYSAAGVSWDFEAAQEDMRATHFSTFPFTATILPTERVDEGHVLGDRSAWHFFNVQKLRADAARLDLDVISWAKLRAFVTEMPGRLYREVEAGHFFFLGARGAKETADHIAELIDEVGELRRQLCMIFGPRPTDH
ncbi:hypothetical protein [Phyllobacterium zundukense]|uniref:Uncharacterized protein n=1 Tax=Phyllobacterium zundukense TaxID=1867719 RepID=A0ACD4CVC2_9HYPH|nr:hypothetical protein [Phyllobacterium zundukense]UXN57508.1 hypothetical protein N8E88_04010 [Phyllobacterium zundukense]